MHDNGKPTPPRTLDLVGVGLVLISALGFSAKGVLIKLSYGISPNIDAISILAVRMLLALPFFLLAGFRYARDAQLVPLGKRDVLAIFLLGFFGYYLSAYLDFQGLAYITANLERLILFLYPTFVVLFGALIFRRRIARYQQAALAIGYLGMMLVFLHDTDGLGADAYRGSALVLAAAISYALYLVFGERIIHRVGAARFTAYTMTVATMLTLLHYVIAHGLALFHLPLQFYVFGIIMALFCTVVPAFMMSAGLQRIGAGATGIVSSIGPVMTMAMTYLVLGETISAIQALGALLVLTGVVVVSRARE